MPSSFFRKAKSPSRNSFACLFLRKAAVVASVLTGFFSLMAGQGQAIAQTATTLTMTSG